MIVLGIDPGSRVTGYGVVKLENNKMIYIASGCIKLSGDFSVRLSQLYDALMQVIGQYEPNECAIESVFMHHNPNSALKLGQARGVCLLALNKLICLPTEYAPRLIKQTVVGSGAALKSQIQFMVQKQLNLSQSPQEDAADALAIAMCHIIHVRQKIGLSS